ncbi:unnamed protein product [Candidula unifasciata]|uniref:Uncharacterized protein n=1 Tax=Candidula unifasciata TaxID=100452 RepID=A0A8S3YNH7_9EUPU|nr:unnamed protein product [Candidula unifasciata]
MAETSGLSIIGKIVAFIVSFIYRLTVQLAVEFLKFFILLAILLPTFCVFGLGYVSFVTWTYVTYNSLPAAICALGLGALMFVLTAMAIQYLVKDVLCLTDQPLSQLAVIYVSSLFRKKTTRLGKDDINKDTPQQNISVTHGHEVQQVRMHIPTTPTPPFFFHVGSGTSFFVRRRSDPFFTSCSLILPLQMSERKKNYITIFLGVLVVHGPVAQSV